MYIPKVSSQLPDLPERSKTSMLDYTQKLGIK